MVGRRGGRVLDKFPQQVHNGIIPAEAVSVADTSVAGDFTEVQWSVPVTLSLRGSTLLEAGKISADLVYDRAIHTYTQAAAPNNTTTAGMGTMRCWVMNERRTAAPSLEDNAVLAYFEWQYFYFPASTTAAAVTSTYPKLESDRHKVIDLEDLKTGQGALVAQPTLYIYAQGNVTADSVLIEEAAWTIRLTLHYRNVETPSGEEFVTELMAKFT